MAGKKKVELSTGQKHTLLHQNLKKGREWRQACVRKRAIKMALREIYPIIHKHLHSDVFELAANDLDWFYCRQRQRGIVLEINEKFCKCFHEKLMKIYHGIDAFRKANPTAHPEDNKEWLLKQQAFFNYASNESNACMDEWLDNMVMAKAVICSEIEVIQRTIEIEIGLV